VASTRRARQLVSLAKASNELNAPLRDPLSATEE
jgi:hypothetical protein